MAKSSEVHNYDDQYENIYNTSKKDKRYRNKKNRKNNKIDFRTLELEEDDDFKIDRYWEETGV
ncbi:hypothetical protein HX837_04415 [Marine Group I thaumarchaeote]|jgi:hypothetical protein|uniref:Uncharacterized protein n=1 Tax=Marine Group I thaumarchaeote TaxID=2511932 RepID=A0A7K4MRB9_9ARCH|nr:hypothetical protein [Nitrosopumilus sp.]NWJ43436.1 hypothetical protein [Marine Group I thaumarchaeote]|tara:strand:- start:215 stop:403 length:189 start_codon:yes stop_codon:yes gene_type:complete